MLKLAAAVAAVMDRSLYADGTGPERSGAYSSPAPRTVNRLLLQPQLHHHPFLLCLLHPFRIGLDHFSGELQSLQVVLVVLVVAAVAVAKNLQALRDGPESVT